MANSQYLNTQFFCKQNYLSDLNLRENAVLATCLYLVSWQITDLAGSGEVSALSPIVCVYPTESTTFPGSCILSLSDNTTILFNLLLRLVSHPQGHQLEIFQSTHTAGTTYADIQQQQGSLYLNSAVRHSFLTFSLPILSLLFLKNTHAHILLFQIQTAEVY